jgi:hypothetical protein
MGPQSIAVNIAQEVLYPDKLKQTITTPMGPVVQAFDGTKGWMAQGPQSRELPEAMAGEMRRGVRMAGSFGLLLDVVEGKAQAQLLEPVEADGKKLDVLLVTEGENSVQLQLDPQTHLPVRLLYRGMSQQGMANMESHASNYREVSGIQFAHEIVTYQNGQKFMEGTLTEVKVNSGIPAESFQKP